MATRREFRVAGQAEPISHFTDAVQAGELLFVSGIVPVDVDQAAGVGKRGTRRDVRQVHALCVSPATGKAAPRNSL